MADEQKDEQKPAEDPRPKTAEEETREGPVVRERRRRSGWSFETRYCGEYDQAADRAPDPLERGLSFLEEEAEGGGYEARRRSHRREARRFTEITSQLQSRLSDDEDDEEETMRQLREEIFKIQIRRASREHSVRGLEDFQQAELETQRRAEAAAAAGAAGGGAGAPQQVPVGAPLGGPGAGAPAGQQPQQPAAPAGQPIAPDPRYWERRELRATFGGEPKKLTYFLTQCTTFMHTWADTFRNQRAQVEFISTYLEGVAADWLFDLSAENAPELGNLVLFLRALHERFHDPFQVPNAKEKLLQCKQGNKRVAEYVDQFRALARQIPDWAEDYKIQLFKAGLDPELLFLAVMHPRPPTLTGWFGLAGRVEGQRTEVRLVHPGWKGVTGPARNPPPAAKGSSKTSTKPGGSTKAPDQSEREGRRRLGLCFQCGEDGHLIANCPRRQQSGERKAAATKPAKPEGGKGGRGGAALMVSEPEGDETQEEPAGNDSGLF